MALEALLEKMIVSLDANTAALKANSSPAAAATGKATTATATTKPTFDFEAVKAMGVKVKDKLGAAAAKGLIKKVGGADGLADVKPDKFAPLMAAFSAAMEEQTAAPEVDEDL